jgi:predicted dehydrogenase
MRKKIEATVGARPEAPRQAHGAARCRRKWTLDSTDRFLTFRFARLNLLFVMTVMGIHIIDAFIHLAGPIAAIRGDSQRRMLDVELDDTTTAFARFASGASGSMSTLTATGRIVRLQVFGTRGWLHLLDHHILEICDVEGRVRRIEYPQVDIERAELEAFADGVAGVEPYPVPIEEAVHGVAVMEAAIRSAQREWQSVSAGLAPV